MLLLFYKEASLLCLPYLEIIIGGNGETAAVGGSNCYARDVISTKQEGCHRHWRRRRIKPVQKKTAAIALLLLVCTVVISLSFWQCLLTPEFSQKDIQVRKEDLEGEMPMEGHPCHTMHEKE
jgi:hypothetical protein